MSLAAWFGAFCAASSLPLFAEDQARDAAQESALELLKPNRLAEAARELESNKDDPSALFSAAVRWESAGDAKRAEKIYSSLIERFPDSPENAKSRYLLALIAQKRNNFAEMESRLLWFLHAPKEAALRAEALWLLGAHYIATRGDRWAAYGCFETLRKDCPTHHFLQMAVNDWKQIEKVSDLDLWSRALARWQPTGLLPDRLPLFLLKKDDIERISQPAPKS